METMIHKKQGSNLFHDPKEREVVYIEYALSDINNVWIPRQVIVETKPDRDFGDEFDFDQCKDGSIYCSSVGCGPGIYNHIVCGKPNKKEIYWKIWAKKPVVFWPWEEGKDYEESRQQIPIIELYKYGYNLILEPIELVINKYSVKLRTYNPFDVADEVSNTEWCEECQDWYSDDGYCSHIYKRFAEENGWEDDD
jgi:hypothetical protein